MLPKSILYQAAMSVIFTLSRFLQPSNAQASILVTLSGIVILARLLEQYQNARKSILVTALPLIFDGITTSAADLLQPVIVIVLPDTV